MQSDNGKADYKKYPKLLKALIRAEKKFLDTHPNSASRAKFSDAYNMVFNDLFCDSYEEYLTNMQPDLWGGQLDTRKFLSDYFNIDL